MIYINGRFLTQKITGVQRYAIEVVKALDNMDLKEDVIILHPKNVLKKLELKNIKMCQIGKWTGHLWEQISLPLYILKHNRKAKLLNFCNLAPILFPSYVVIHDISFKTYSKHLDWKFVFWYKFVTKVNVKRYKHIFTVSEFSKKEIINNYNIQNEKITVTYNSADHIKNIEPDNKIIKKLNLINKDFIFSLGSKSAHKNYSFIVECSKRNKNLLFVITGNENNKVFKSTENKDQNNLIYTGYLTDNEIVALYKNCKAFLYPSLYEGFGIPPLEALTVGCKNVLLSDIEVFKEIYGESVHYINLKDNNCYKIDSMLNEQCKQINGDKYSWNEVTRKILNIIV